MSIVKVIARQGNITVHPQTGEILYAGSVGFNRSMQDGSAAKIWFHVTTPDGKPACFASYDVEKDLFNVSDEIVTRHSMTLAAVDAALSLAKKIREIAYLRDYVANLTHGKRDRAK